jgi:hypothetical protein
MYRPVPNIVMFRSSSWCSHRSCYQAHLADPTHEHDTTVINIIIIIIIIIISDTPLLCPARDPRFVAHLADTSHEYDTTVKYLESRVREGRVDFARLEDRILEGVLAECRNDAWKPRGGVGEVRDDGGSHDNSVQCEGDDPINEYDTTVKYLESRVREGRVDFARLEDRILDGVLAECRNDACKPRGGGLWG